MFSEPTEFALVTKLRRSRRQDVTFTSDSAVVDEAFAELPIKLDECHRVDRPQLSTDDTSEHEESGLLGRIATEVATLNRRCAHLSEMIRTLDSPTNTK